MTFDKRTREQMLQYCLEVHEDDGEHARQTLRKRKIRKKSDHKIHQLCRQVFETLSLAIADAHDDLLAQVQVVAVEPAPDASRLRVIVTGECGADASTIAEASGRLESHAARLRCEVAAAITRRKAPVLIFQWRRLCQPPGVCPRVPSQGPNQGDQPEERS